MNNRQNGRRGRGRGGNGGMRPMGGGQDRGNRIDNRARGNANQLHEKYKTLARDAQMQGDRVMTEYYLQFADHYFRVLAETRGRFEEQRPQRRDFQDDFDGDGDGDGGDDFAGEYAEREPRRDTRQDERGDRAEREPRREGREGRQDDRAGDRGDRGGERRSNGHYNGHAEGREQRGERREPREPREPRSDGYAPPAPADADAGAVEVAEAPRRGRGRPRRERPVEADGGDRLTPPSFLSEGVLPMAPPVEASGEEPAAPRRRTRRPRADAAELPAEA